MEFLPQRIRDNDKNVVRSAALAAVVSVIVLLVTHITVLRAGVQATCARM